MPLVFCAAVTFIAAICLLLMLPKSPAQRPMRLGEQLSILGLPQLWLSVLTTVFIASGLFSVFSYSAQYLVQKIGVPLANVSLILMLFGIGGVAGNVLIGSWLDQRLVTTLLTQLKALTVMYLVICFLATPWLPGMGLIALCWGATHAAGPVASQVWLRTSARRAPDFATSIYLTAANIGVVTGSTVSGWMIEEVGLEGAIGCGLVFIGLAVLSVFLRIGFYRNVGDPTARNITDAV
jgi:predicted MFS family arabinose efflux permease